MLRRIWLILIASICLLSPALAAAPSVRTADTTYYVANDGDDDNDGLTPGTAFATIAKVNTLALEPGDKVLFACGDVWRAEMLVITQSGAEGNPITFGSYPEGCEDKPILSGAQPISGWSVHAGNIYVADLAAGDNAGKFGLGINQLFRDGERLRLGRWPNLDDLASDNGYATIEDQPAGDRITDDELPAVDWTGAIAHIRGMRWYILNREVSSTSGTTLHLNTDAECHGSDCTGWGYFLNNHLSTLDQDGEWYHDAATNRVYLYSASGAPANIEGSVILEDDDRSWGGVVLGDDLGDRITDVVVENLDVRHSFRHGIATPTNLHAYENQRVTLRDNAITDVDGIGINLATWVYDAQDGGESGWRGGSQIELSNNVIDGANHRGIDSYAQHSTIEYNVIRNIALTENLGASGMGCDTTSSGGFCTEDGDGIRIKVSKVADSGNNNTIRYNRLERVGYNGMDIFGPHNTIAYNVIEQACYSKGDCGGVRTFGSSNLSSTNVHDLTFNHNIILDTIGNTDGCIGQYQPLFGFGLYIDNYSRDVAITGNTILSSTVAGIHYQRSTGSVTGNTLYNNSRGTMYSAQAGFDESVTQISNHSGNVLYSLNDKARTLSLSAGAGVTSSDNNYFFNPYLAKHISASGTKTLAEWQAHSGLDAHSVEHWFTLASGDPPLSRVFYNDTSDPIVVDLGSAGYLDLDQNEVNGSITLQPYTSRVLVYDSEVTAPDLSPSTKTASTVSVVSGERLTYTVAVCNEFGPMTHTVAVTDVVPAGLAYVPGSLVATSGIFTDTGAPTLRWSGTLTPTPVVTLTYAVTVTAGTPQAIRNTATLAAPGYQVITRTATVIANGHGVCLPLVMR